MTIVVESDGGRTFKDVQNAALGNDFDANTYGDQVRQFINDALIDIARRGALPLLEATATLSLIAGSQTQSLPADLIRLISVYVNSPRGELDEVAIDDFDSYPSSAGVPVAFAEYQNTLYLYPAPQAGVSLLVRYRRAPDLLENDSQAMTATLPSGYEHMLVAFARSRLFAFEDDAQMQQFWMGEYERMLGLLKSDVGRRNRSRVRQVPGMWQRSRSPRFVRPA